MTLQKQGINISFGQGLDTKTDPNQVAAGKMLNLQNAIFDKGGLLQKRNGFVSLSALPNSANASNLSTLNNNLIATGSNLYSYNQDTSQWFFRGSVQPVNVSSVKIALTSKSQITCDAALAPNNLLCTVFVDSTNSLNYIISDSVTGQSISNIINISSNASPARVNILGNYFVISYIAVISSTPTLQTIAIPYTNPSLTPIVTTISTSVSSISSAFDTAVLNNNIYYAWQAPDSGGSLRINYLTANLNIGAVRIINSVSTKLISLAPDTSIGTGIVWVSYADNSNNVKTFPIINTLVNYTGFTTTTTASSVNIAQLTTYSLNGVLTLVYDNNNTYSYDSNTKTNFISKNTINLSASVSSVTNIIRSVGLASKMFLINGSYYMLTIYGQSSQPGYFLIDITGNVIAKLAYSNAVGYNTTKLLPNVSIDGSNANIPYLYASQLQSVNKLQGVTNTAGIYTQAAVGYSTFNINSNTQYSSEIAGSLCLTGGILWQYDGLKPVENGFLVWPDNVKATASNSGGGLAAQQYYYVATYEWLDGAGNLHRSAPSIPVSATVSSGTAITTASTLTAGSNVITVTSNSGLYVGQIITNTTTPSAFPAGTYITNINGTSVTLSNPSTISAGSDVISTNMVGSCTVNIPYLRLTYKSTPNPATLVVYRWSVAQQNYYKVNSVNSSILNDPTQDSISFVDTTPDIVILGNSLLYTTGGVVENIAPPASTVSTLYKNRLMLVDAEDQNTIWYSKQVIENTPVEMSDLFTIYVAPSTGAQGSTGPITALSAMDDKLIIFKKDAIYYVAGIGPDNTGANNDFTDAVYITSTAGCINPASIVMQPNGLMFQSDKGIWLLQRNLATTYIGADVEAYNSNNVLSALNIPATNQVRFTLDNGVTLMYDYYYNQWGTFTNIPGISSVVQNNLHTYLNSNGQIKQETPGRYLDDSSPVLMSFTTSWLKISGLQGFQRAYALYLLANYISPHKLSVGISYDYVTAPSQQAIISPTNYNPKYGNDGLYGSSNPYGGPSSLEQWRVFLNKQKCQSLQLTISELFDSTLGVTAGAGFTMSGVNLLIGGKNTVPKPPSSGSIS